MGTAEPARSSFFPFLLFSPTISRRVAARFFAETLGASKAGSYQAGGESTLGFQGVIGRKLGRRSEQIWRFQK